jgi:hypothetical protein
MQLIVWHFHWIIHVVFQIVMFRKYLYDRSHVISHEYVKLNESLSYIGHSTTIIDKKVKPLCSKDTVLVKVI